ncbi:TorD/DmsD family molecular chaperone [Vibrio diazotrophicus]|uniref:TorD/DmsD family molecular chaperone n=1 Tax=Vibrio diazotrophicus TaxID=685 RepID=UPI000C9DBA2C|nr:molecular chaperone [Vibrio diazotrophicus]PNH81426.1 dehydrogenase [Vibrio diazotrophicus]
MNPLIVVFQLLGQNLYCRPSNENKQIRDNLTQLPELLNWPDENKIANLVQALPALDIEELEYQFSVLFEGQGQMPCPPWGSVYLDKDNIVFGETTAQYRNFLRQNGLEIISESKEPEDQFGLMLLALSQLLEKGEAQAGMELITEHLMPWGTRYLELLAKNEVSQYYAIIAQITQDLFDSLQHEFEYKAAEKTLYL